MNAYNVFIDPEMLRNVIETDFKETLELLNFSLVSYIIAFGLVPAWLVANMQIAHEKFFKELLYKTLNISLSIVLILAISLTSFKAIISLYRMNKHLRYKLMPTNYIESCVNLVIDKLRLSTADIRRKPIAEDAEINTKFYEHIKHPNLLIFVVGEAARAQSFSLNGYERATDEALKKHDLINFTNFYSCGTSTAVSVPCIFSHLGRKNFSVNKAKMYGNILDILRKKGFSLFWRDNNSGCKGVCEGISFKSYRGAKTSHYCNNEECFDEVMLEGLSSDIKKLRAKNIVVILHQSGSHGPAYFRRIPKKFEKFKPICMSENFGKCTRQEIINAYDNTIYYTSYFLSQTIDLLKNQFPDYNTALIYVSDHGQSTGENGLYLHGIPYIIAPEQQIHIPAFIWLSNKFFNAFNLDVNCLRKKQNEKFSHDNIFHSLLGLFRISTKIYNKNLDLFSGCSKIHEEQFRR